MGRSLESLQLPGRFPIRHGEDAKSRVKRYRRRILEISQRVQAMHVAGAFSCLEIVDKIYHELMKEGDTFIMSKGHGAMAQYVILEDQGKINLDDYCKGPIGCHPDLHVPGIACATGSLGHGLGMAVGMAYADPDHSVYVLISDGELQEGSTWEALLLANALEVLNLQIYVDYNMQNSSISTEPWLDWLQSKMEVFAPKLNGQIKVEYTVKGAPFKEMQEPIWHYKSPDATKYAEWMKQLA